MPTIVINTNEDNYNKLRILIGHISKTINKKSYLDVNLLLMIITYAYVLYFTYLGYKEYTRAATLFRVVVLSLILAKQKLNYRSLSKTKLIVIVDRLSIITDNKLLIEF